MTRITEHLGRLRERVRISAEAAGRTADSVSIVAVTKRHPATVAEAAIAAGLTDLGENYLQEALGKIEALSRDARWHFIGPIQSNKTRAIAEHFDWVQTIGSAKIAKRLDNQRPAERGLLQALIQVQPRGASGRAGATAQDIDELAEVIDELPRLVLRGLMIIPLPGLDSASLREEFARVRQLYERLQHNGLPLDTLSMGMSGDFDAAVREGSTMIRVGTALFGARENIGK